MERERCRGLRRPGRRRRRRSGRRRHARVFSRGLSPPRSTPRTRRSRPRLATRRRRRQSPRRPRRPRRGRERTPPPRRRFPAPSRSPSPARVSSPPRGPRSGRRTTTPTTIPSRRRSLRRLHHPRARIRRPPRPARYAYTPTTSRWPPRRYSARTSRISRRRRYLLGLVARWTRSEPPARGDVFSTRTARTANGTPTTIAARIVGLFDSAWRLAQPPRGFAGRKSPGTWWGTSPPPPRIPATGETSRRFQPCWRRSRRAPRNPRR